MTAEKFEMIKNKLEVLKERKIKAMTILDQLTKQLKEQGLDSLDDAKKRVEELKKSIASDEEKLKDIEAKLDTITDWSKI